MKPIIREATFDDIDNGLLNVFIEGYNFHQKGRPDIFSKKSPEELKRDIENTYFKMQLLVVLIDEKIAGYVAFEIKEKTKRKIHLDQLVIKEEYRHQGLGKALINKVKEIGLEKNCDRIELDCWLFNENALKMYEHTGFKEQRIMFEMKL